MKTIKTPLTAKKSRVKNKDASTSYDTRNTETDSPQKVREGTEPEAMLGRIKKAGGELK